MSANPLSLALTAASMIQSRNQAKAQMQANVRSDRSSAARVAENAAREEEQLRRDGRRLLGRQRTRIAKAGVRLEGSPLLAQEETLARNKLDALEIRRAGETRSAELLERARNRRKAGRSFPLDAATLLTRSTGPGGSGFPVLSPGLRPLLF